MTVTKEISGVIELVGGVKTFGQNRRVNIKLKDSEEEWISLVSTEDVVLNFVKEYAKGDKIKATCKAHMGKDYEGTSREEFWIQEVTKIVEVAEKIPTEVIAVNKHLVESLRRAAKIVDDARIAKTDEGRDALVAAVFSKIARHEHYLRGEDL